MTKRIVRRLDVRTDSRDEESSIYELSGEVAIQGFARPLGVLNLQIVGPTENLWLEGVQEFQLYAPQEVEG